VQRRNGERGYKRQDNVKRRKRKKTSKETRKHFIHSNGKQHNGFSREGKGKKITTTNGKNKKKGKKYEQSICCTCKEKMKTNKE
jgi:hypothetical protein